MQRLKLLAVTHGREVDLLIPLPVCRPPHPGARQEHTGLKSLVVNEYTESMHGRLTTVKHGSSVMAREENQ